MHHLPPCDAPPCRGLPGAALAGDVQELGAKNIDLIDFRNLLGPMEAMIFVLIVLTVLLLSAHGFVSTSYIPQSMQALSQPSNQLESSEYRQAHRIC